MVSSSPRVVGIRCGTKVTLGLSPARRIMVSISGVCRCHGAPYAFAFSLAVTNPVLTLGFAPAPLTPERAFTVMERIEPLHPPHDGRERQYGRRRVATGVRDDPSLRRPEELRQDHNEPPRGAPARDVLRTIPRIDQRPGAGNPPRGPRPTRPQPPATPSPPRRSPCADTRRRPRPSPEPSISAGATKLSSTARCG